MRPLWFFVYCDLLHGVKQKHEQGSCCLPRAQLDALQGCWQRQTASCCGAASGGNGGEEGPRGGHEDAVAAAKDKAVKMAMLQRNQQQQQQQQLAQVSHVYPPLALATLLLQLRF